jgi:hypothetical protein
MGVVAGRPVLILVGGAAASLAPELEDARRKIVERVIVPLCRDERTIVITGGTDAGIMQEVGRAVEDLAPNLVLIGVAPDRLIRGFGAPSHDRDAAAPEPHHLLIRTPGNAWGDEASTLVRVAERLASQRIVMVAIGGGEGTRREVDLAMNRAWPLALITGFEGTSDELAQSLQEGERSAERSTPADGDAKARSAVIVFEAGDQRRLERALRWRLSEQEVLREAWARFAVADRSAVELKNPTAWGARAVIAIAALTVALAVALGKIRETSPWWVVVKASVTALPLVAGIVLGLMERSARIGTWFHLRAAAESLLREIYRFRAIVPPYDSADVKAHLFTETLEKVDARAGDRLSKVTDEQEDAWSPKKLWERIPAEDTLLGPLTPRVYDEVRVQHQLRFLSKEADATSTRAGRWTIAVYVAAALTAFFLAVSWRDGWAGTVTGVIASILAAAFSWREYQQWDAKAGSYRRTVLALRANRARWLAMRPDEQDSPEALTWYAQGVEDALAAENADWERAVKQAQHTLFDRYRGK